MKKILLPLAEGFEEIELVSVADVLRRAEIEVTLASLHSSLEVVGAHQITLKADTLFSAIQIKDFSGIVLAGGMSGVQNMQQHAELKAVIMELYHCSKLIAGICAAPILLDELGLLNDDFCCYPSCELKMKNTKSQRLKQGAFRSNNLITGTGPAFAMEFALEIVAYLLGEQKLNSLKTELLYH